MARDSDNTGEGTVIDQVEMRQRAFDTLMPSWTAVRREVASAQSDVEQARAAHKGAKEVLSKLETSIEHVANCRLIACLACEEIAINSANPSTR